MYDKEFEDLIPGDHTLSIPKLLLILNRLESAMIEWLKEISKDPLIKEKIEDLLRLLQSVKPSEFPSLKKLEESQGTGKWSGKPSCSL